MPRVRCSPLLTVDSCFFLSQVNLTLVVAWTWFQCSMLGWLTVFDVSGQLQKAGGSDGMLPDA